MLLFGVGGGGGGGGEEAWLADWLILDDGSSIVISCGFRIFYTFEFQLTQLQISIKTRADFINLQIFVIFQ